MLLLVTKFVFLLIFETQIFNCLNTSTYLEENNYHYELHQISTEDGYILTYHRIIQSKYSQSTTLKKPAVLLVHGVLTNSGCYLFDPNQSLGYILSDMGYDVWLANCRGTSWSRQHCNLNPDKNPRQFFNFSFHEIGYYDLPAAIDYILSLKNHSSLYYIGHSQGGTVFLVMSSTRPEYNKKIRLAALMAPASFFENQRNSFVRFISKFVYELENVMKLLRFYHLPFAEDARSFLSKFCVRDDHVICSVLFYLFGGNIKQHNLSDFFATFPDDNPLKQFFHYLQLIKNGGFKQFDYRYFNNPLIHQKVVPPRYKLEKISAPVALYYGKNDRVVNFQDVEKLRNLLPQVVDSFLVSGHFEHSDFLLNKNVYKRLYQRLIKILELH